MIFHSILSSLLSLSHKFSSCIYVYKYFLKYAQSLETLPHELASFGKAWEARILMQPFSHQNDLVFLSLFQFPGRTFENSHKSLLPPWIQSGTNGPHKTRAVPAQKRRLIHSLVKNIQSCFCCSFYLWR